MNTDQPTLAVTQAAFTVDAKVEYPAFCSWWSRTIPAVATPSSASHHFDAWMASAAHRTTHEPRPAGDLREAIKEVLIAHGHRRCSASIEGLSGILPEIEATADEIAALATHSPAPMAGEVERLREALERIAASERGAGIYDILGNTAIARAALASLPSTQEGADRG